LYGWTKSIKVVRTWGAPPWHFWSQPVALGQRGRKPSQNKKEGFMETQVS